MDLLFQVRVLAGQWFDAFRQNVVFICMKDLRTIILAAGKGTRMRSDVPKVLHPVCGRPMIRYVLDIAKAIGSLKTYVVLGHKGDAVKDVPPIAPKITFRTPDRVRRTQHFRLRDGSRLPG